MARRSVWKSTNTKEVFLNEAREDLSSLNDALVLLEKGPTPGETVREIARAAHTLKGMPATIGYEPTARLTHQMQTVLEPSLPIGSPAFTRLTVVAATGFEPVYQSRPRFPQQFRKLLVSSRPREPHGPARPPHGDLVVLHQHGQDFSFRGRRHRFRLRTSLIAAFSSGSSAYIRLGFAFSASKSRRRFSSSTEAPAYFTRQ